MSLDNYFAIASIGLVFGFLISVAIGVLGTIANVFLGFLKQY